MPQVVIPTARVFIWYPHDDHHGDWHVGHVSMYIGNYEVGKKFELSLDPDSPRGVADKPLERDFGIRGVHYNDNYVSWWPDGEGAMKERGSASPKLGLYADVAAEYGLPHVVYDLYELNVGAMRACWRQTRDKPGATFQYMRKNCATIVAKVLQAGGAMTKIGTLNSQWFGKRMYWTPKRVAQICNLLRDRDLAVKTKAGNCPTKSSGLVGAVELVFGFR
jgi:hypothetical protein